ncbi:Holliday junction resolvase RuvX [Aestuariispira insulae]|uniref:Putative pre-16S rRNA nuclease n=1 Tax=Aestuariispira insulae TaxID=1461337 RepID=A0A3D9HNN2_9PROT|nr:Holliday junction resolvase RuvX [Aestuariispira insulae]RED50911.1 putative Holliday junction resolvase [Aestuariispira insulae]
MIVEIYDLASHVTKGKRLLALDLGEKTIGMAVSDPAFRVGSPLDTIRRKKFTTDVEQLEAVIAEKNIGGLVIGLPRNMDGTEGPRCQSVRQFARNFEKRGWEEMPITFWDERLSTSAVERFLVDEADMSRKKRGEVVDKMAAGFILQGALDAMVEQAMRNSDSSLD